MSRTKDHTYLKNRAHAFAQSDVCWICGGWLDPELKWPDPWSRSADHVVPVSRGGHNRGEVKPVPFAVQPTSRPQDATRRPRTPMVSGRD
jgi:hypothetical protein